MKFKVQIIVETESEEAPVIQEIACLERGLLQPDELGLTLGEAKAVLQNLQKSFVQQQTQTYLQQQARCPHCGQRRFHKGTHTLVYHTLFGKLQLLSPRFFHCRCLPQATRTFSPLAALLTERVAPELRYLEGKFAALVSYGQTVKLLSEVLPMSEQLNATTVRNHTLQTAERLENELGEEKTFFINGCQRDWEELPRPELPLTVGLDGGYVHSCEQTSKSDGWFEVIVGKSMTAQKTAKCFGFVNSYDEKPKRRIFEVLQAQGMQMNQQITFLSDGGDTVRELQLYLNPQAEHLLDWFHVTMRLTVMKQLARGLGAEGTESRDLALQALESIKWYLWHGNVQLALERVEDLEVDLEAEVISGENQQKLQQAVQGFRTYIENNQRWIPNYGERYRHGEAISSAFAESTVNQVISKRMVKKQQMRWSKRGAHLFLQVRTRVLNDEWEGQFRTWYPNFRGKLGLAPPAT